MREPDLNLNRREFLVASGAVAAGKVSFQSTSALLAAESAEPWVFKPVEIPAWIRKATRKACVKPGEIEKAAELGVQVCHDIPI